MTQLPEGYQVIPEEEQRKARAFFERAKAVADTGNFEYAIDLMIEGLKRDPDSVEAHQMLREISLKRKASGGKELGVFERMKYGDTKDERESMLNRERLLAYDPGNTDYMLGLMEKAYAAGFYDTVLWIGQILTQANSSLPKPDYKKYLAAAKIYKALRRWDLALLNTQLAYQLRPNDMELGNEVKNLSAYKTMEEGNYASGKSFRESVRDKEKQQDLLEADKDIRSAEGMQRLIQQAEREYAADPNEPGKLMKLVDVLVKTEDPEHESRALELLDEAYKKTGQFRFRARIGEINMKQMLRMERGLREALKQNPNDAALKKDLEDFHRDRLELELKEYRLLSEAYPSETKWKYEVAARLFALHRYDEAIPALQQARQDPKFRVDAMLLLGRAFFEAGFIDEARDTFEELINGYELKGDEKSKEMYYWRGRAAEQLEDFDTAVKSYSQVAQWDFGYRDVQNRIRTLRQRPKA
ncbi:MAG: tetratricopeptide repeat protein [Tepidisphaerales bacterium]